MYAWFWRQLPGSTALRVVLSALVLLVLLVLLWFVVFPLVDAHLPYADVTVDRT